MYRRWNPRARHESFCLCAAVWYKAILIDAAASLRNDSAVVYVITSSTFCALCVILRKAGVVDVRLLNEAARAGACAHVLDSRNENSKSHRFSDRWRTPREMGILLGIIS